MEPASVNLPHSSAPGPEPDGREQNRQRVPSSVDGQINDADGPPAPLDAPLDGPPFGGPPPLLPRNSPLRTLLQILVFGVIFFIASNLIALFYGLVPNLLLISAITVFLGSLVATAVVLRVYSHGAPLRTVGLHWNSITQHNLWKGIGLGIAFGAAVTVMPVLISKASWSATDTSFAFGSLVFFVVLILFGAIGEEVLFRGFVFQRLHETFSESFGETFGATASVVITSALFAWAHGQNLGVTWLALANTFAWGVVFGIARLRSNDLWLPIGIHAGWNWTLPLLGVELSGFTLEVTGIRLRGTEGSALDTYLNGGAYGPEGSIFTTLAMPLIVYILWRARSLRSV
jgi:uncharacterized protein